jgi:hypothetical protein
MPRTKALLLALEPMAKQTTARKQHAEGARSAAITGSADDGVEPDIGYGPGKVQPALFLMRGLGGVGRQRAHGSFAEVLAFDAKGVVVPGPVILPGDCRGEFDQLCGGELLAQTSEESLGDLDRRLRHGVGVLENQSIQVRKVVTAAVIGKGGNLFGGDAVCSADGRTDVDSKRTPDESRDAEFRKVFQLRVHQFAAGLGLFHLSIPPEDCGMMRGHLKRHDQAAESAFGQGIKPSNEEPAEGSTGVSGSTGNAGHRSSLVSFTHSSI